MKSEGSEFEILFIVIALGIVVFVASTFTATFINPSMTKSIASVKSLADSINEVCEKGQNSKAEVSVALPQNIVKAELDLKVTKISIGKGVFPRAALVSTGDPNVLLYYESFPPGEAVSWELHNDLGRRVVYYYKDAHYDTLDCAGEERCILKRLEENSDNLGNKYTVFGNLLLKDWEKNGINFVGDVGEWNDGRTKYSFTHYDTIGNLNRTAIKYRVCGVNALCMKTRDSVLVFPLDKCDAAGINYVQLEGKHDMFRGTEAGIKSVVVLVNAVPWTKVVAKGAWLITASKADILSFRLKSAANRIERMLPGIFDDTASATKTSFYTAAGLTAEDTNVVQAIEDLVSTADGRTDFYLASPCEAELVVENTQCTCWDGFPHILGFEKVSKYGQFIQYWEAKGSGENYVIKRDNVNTGFRCRNRIDREGFRKEIENEVALNDYLEDVNKGASATDRRACVKVTVKSSNGFCYSKFSGLETKSEYPLYQSAFVNPVNPDAVTLESSSQFPRPEGVGESELFGAAAYTWP